MNLIHTSTYIVYTVHVHVMFKDDVIVLTETKHDIIVTEAGLASSPGPPSALTFNNFASGDL